jgi:4-carboxymuconolactone decarboxylase
MTRLPDIVENGDAEIVPVFAEIAASRGFVSQALRSLGHAPEALLHFARLGEYIKYRSALTNRDRELAIVCAGRSISYEWEHHAPLAKQEGITAAELDAIKKGEVPATLTAPQQHLVRLILELFTVGELSRKTFRAATEHWSPQQITDVLFTATYYNALGTMATALGVELESDDVLELEQAWQRKLLGGTPV